MELNNSDLLFLAICLWIAVFLINNDGGGGRRQRVPAQS